MSHMALVIADPAKAHQAQRAMYQRPGLPCPDLAPPVAGDLWTTADLACPDGLPNCRQCGDPAHAAACAAAGHCPHCGTRHGIAPDAVLAAKGLVLLPLAAPPADGTMWDRRLRRFVPREGA